MHFWCTFDALFVFSQNLLISRKMEKKLRKFFPISKFTKLVNLLVLETQGSCWSTSASEPACLGSRPRNHCTGAKPCFLSCSFLMVAHMSMVSSGEAVEPAAQTRWAMPRNILLQTSTFPNCQCDSAAACRSWMSCLTRYLWKSTEMFLWSGSMKTVFGGPKGLTQTSWNALERP